MLGIYALPENPSAMQIIERSIVAHPSAFYDGLIAQAEMHGDYSDLSQNLQAKQGATAQCRACLAICETLRLVPHLIGGSKEASEINTMIIALNAACKLQCLPPHIRTQAAIKWDEEHVA